MHASLSALQAAEGKRAAAQTEADAISFLQQHVAELTEELEVSLFFLSLRPCRRDSAKTERAFQ